MHEFSLCQSLLKSVLRVASEHKARRVSRVTLRLGPLAGVEPLLIREAFALAREGTLAEIAELVIEPQPVRVRCGRCGAESEVKPNRLLCGRCGHWQTQLLSGDEMLLASIQLEQ